MTDAEKARSRKNKLLTKCYRVTRYCCIMPLLFQSSSRQKPKLPIPLRRATSPNAKNVLSFVAEPLEKGLAGAIEKEEIRLDMPKKTM